MAGLFGEQALHSIQNAKNQYPNLLSCYKMPFWGDVKLLLQIFPGVSLYLKILLNPPLKKEDESGKGRDGGFDR